MKIVHVFCARCQLKPLGHAAGMIGGLGIMLIGTTMTVNAHALFEAWYALTMWECVAFTVHAIGAVPFVGHGAKIYNLATGG